VPVAALLVKDEFGHVALVIGDESDLSIEVIVKIISFTFGKYLKVWLSGQLHEETIFNP
jgi:hypothetical protein